MIKILADLLFPPKCILCRRVLDSGEVDLCPDCRTDSEERPNGKLKLSFIDSWSTLWYYEDNVRSSLHRYKFRNARSYASVYGRLLAMKLQKEFAGAFDILTWVPVSPKRRWERGYDQVELLAMAVGCELGITPVCTLQKIRDNPPQSGITGYAQRKANVLGVYKAVEPAALHGKRVLLLDDIITTGATSGECARVLLTAGAKEVICAAIAAAPNEKISR